MYTEIDERMTNVEAALAEFIIQTNKSFLKLHNEMKDFKNEMKDFKDEMKDFKDEMKDFKDEMRTDRKEMNKQWGELANKMGTLVEDIIAPAVRPVLEKYFGEEITYIAVNVRKKDSASDLQGEFDIVAVSRNNVYLVETKSAPKLSYLQQFKESVIPRFLKLFPEYKELTLVPIFASLRFEKTFLAPASKQGTYLMAYREWEYMDLLNFDALSPKKR